MNYLLGILVAFLLFPVIISSLAQLSKYFDEKTINRSKDDSLRDHPAVSNHVI